jgi:hypothetical protein
MAAKSNLLASGRARTLGGGRREWRAALYAPGGKYKSFRVVFKEDKGDDVWDWTSRNASTEDEARKLFEQVELALDAHRAAPARARVQQDRTIKALGQLYLSESRAEFKEDRTIEQRESRLNAHIVPSIGTLGVAKWRLEHTRSVMDRAYATVRSVRGREDLRGQLGAMRNLAWREGWLDRSIDPLDGFKLKKATRMQGADDSYVDPHLRPETRQVNAMASAADNLCGPDGEDPLLTRLPLFGTKVRVAGYGGLRAGVALGGGLGPEQGDPHPARGSLPVARQVEVLRRRGSRRAPRGRLRRRWGAAGRPADGAADLAADLPGRG